MKKSGEEQDLEAALGLIWIALLMGLTANFFGLLMIAKALEGLK